MTTRYPEASDRGGTAGRAIDLAGSTEPAFPVIPAEPARRIVVPGGTASTVIDLSNSRRTRRALSNAEAFERVCRFLATGDPRHLPPALRPEADGIMALVAAHAAGPELPWSATAPPPGAPIGDMVRALAGDEIADADSGLLDDGAGAS